MNHEPSQEQLDVLYWSHQLLRYIAQSDEAALGMITAKRRLREARARLREATKASGIRIQASEEAPDASAFCHLTPRPPRHSDARRLVVHAKWRKEEAS